MLVPKRLLDKTKIDLGRQYNDLVENNEAFKHFISSIEGEIQRRRGFLEVVDTRSGNPDLAHHEITTIQALRWVLELVDDTIQDGINEATKAAIQEDPRDPEEGQSRR